MIIYLRLVKKTKCALIKSSQKNLLDILLPNMDRDLLHLRFVSPCIIVQFK